MSKSRKEVSSSNRFKVLLRDDFTCRYCGRRAPDVQLVVDHVTPISKGGTNDFENLATSCYECNNGKSDSIVSRQRKSIGWNNPYRQLSERILRRLKKAGSEGMSRAQINDFLKGMIPSKAITEALNLLAEEGFASGRMVASKTRPREMWAVTPLSILSDTHTGECVTAKSLILNYMNALLKS